MDQCSGLQCTVIDSVLQGKLFGNHVISQFGNIHLPLSPPPVIISCWATLRAKCRVEHSTYKQHNEEGRHKALRLWEGGAGHAFDPPTIKLFLKSSASLLPTLLAFHDTGI